MTQSAQLYRVNVYEQIRLLYNKTLLHTPTKTIVKQMGQGYYRTYRALVKLEEYGIVQCQRTSQSLWRPSPLAGACYGILLQSYRRAHDYIPTETIAIQLATNDRIVRGELTRLESAGIITRNGQRGGWKPKRITQPTAVEQLIDTVRQLYQQTQHHIPTNTIADVLNVHPSHVRNRLVTFEQMGYVYRTSPRSGWLPITA